MQRATGLCALALLGFIQGGAATNEYIAVPGSWACPRDCTAPLNSGQCALGAKELGLPCGATVNRVVTKTSQAPPVQGFHLDDMKYLLGIYELSGSVVLKGNANADALIGTELVSLSYVDANSQLQHTAFSNRTDAVQDEMDLAWSLAPLGLVTLTFKDACSVSNFGQGDVELKKSTMGGCSWSRGNGLNYNDYNQAGRHDVWPWEQVPGGKALIPGEGANAFRICLCTVMPKYVAVMHAKCAPSCRRGFDPCTQHKGCKRIDDWHKCKEAATELEWVPMRGGQTGPTAGWGAATPVGPGRDALDGWNDMFRQADWLANRGTTANNENTGTPLCATGGSSCLNNPIWQETTTDSEWTTAGLIGGRGRWYQFLNDTVSTFPADALIDTQWLSYKDLGQPGALQVFPPPGLNFLGDKTKRHIPGQLSLPPAPSTGRQPWPTWWAPTQPFLDNGFGSWDGTVGGEQPGSKSRPEGCTFKHDVTTDPLTFFWPWNTLRLNKARNDEKNDACCPAGSSFGVDCFVTNCTVQPCLDWESGGACARQTAEVEDTFAICECTEDNSHSNDECIFFGQPCGAGQTCTDPDAVSEPDVLNPAFVCTCNAQPALPITGGPTVCPHYSATDLSYVAKPAGRDCGDCHRIVSPQQCTDAAVALGLSDTVSTIDLDNTGGPVRTRPCGCHYSELDGICADDNGECLRFNKVMGDAVYNGCQAYEAADAHDFLLCACYNSMPKYVAAPVVACPTTCEPIVSKVDCRTAAEYIGMHLALHEEKEALLLLNGQLAPSKLHDYTGLDNNTYQHKDDGLGPVVGDPPSIQASRPPGCHYRRRYDADVLPAGSTVNWPHLLFNPKQDSTTPSTTQDMLICRCADAEPPAPTPAPTATADAWATRLGLVSAGQGACDPVASNGWVLAATAFQATFHTCADLCMVSSSCEAISWYNDADRTFDTEGLGECKHYQCLQASAGPCPAMTTVVAMVPVEENFCYQKPGPTPAPTPVPTGLVSEDCYHFCCQQNVREACCAVVANTAGVDSCVEGSDDYCMWTLLNACTRNLKDRGDSPSIVEINFNVSGLNFDDADLAALAVLVAKDAVTLVGSPTGSFEPDSQYFDRSANLFTVNLKCPAGGCGDFAHIAQSLCPAGVDISVGLRSATQAFPAGRCFGAGALSEQNSMNLFGGANLQPVFVRVKAPECVAGLSANTVDLGNGGIPGSNMQLNYVAKQVGGGNSWENSIIEPAFTDAPAVDKLCQVPDFLRGYTHFRMAHSVPVGASFEFLCPSNCGVCDLFVFQFHDPPCSSEYNGRYPALLTADGWAPSRCAPKLCGNNAELHRTVGYRKQVQSGTTTTLPPVETACLSYFGLFAAEGVFCEDNTLQDEAACTNAGGLCKWSGTECVSEWCPAGGVGTPPGACVVPGDLECASPLTSSELEGILSLSSVPSTPVTQPPTPPPQPPSAAR